MVTKTTRTGICGVLLVCTGLLSGCAGGLGTTRHTTLIATDPQPATCDLRGAGYSTRIATPARLEIPKSAAPVTMTCRADGHRPFETTLKPQFNPKILGNFMIGSTLGMLSDMVGGHDTIYPRRLTINLEPLAFASLDDRDRWFDRFRRSTWIRWQMTLDALGETCDGQEDTLCHDRIAVQQDVRDTELAALERRRNAARVLEDLAERPALP
tara:strand:+ start:96 stop:731 length:636 start_codon:yes stop_codon:yes gene_type:complete